MAERHVLIDFTVLDMIQKVSQTCSGQPESGGILFGSLRGPHLHVTSFTRPGPNDQRSTFQFIRRDAIHQRLADQAWTLSSGTVTFVGEWHTHPSGLPKPSSTDARSWSDLVRAAKHPMIFLIAAPEAWRGFLVTRCFFRCSIRSLATIEHGDSGVVLR